MSFREGYRWLEGVRACQIKRLIEPAEPGQPSAADRAAPRPGAASGRGRGRTPGGRAAIAERLEVRALLSGSDLDPTFGAGGVAEVGVVAAVNDRARAMAVRPDGRFVVATDAEPSSAGPILHGFLPDGRADPAFGTGGEARVRRADLAVADVLVANPDGSFLAGRTGIDAATAPVVRRLTAAGAVDPAWALPAAVAGELVALAPIGDGRTFAVTTKTVALLRADGSLDASFGGTGAVAAPAASATDYVNFRGAAAGADGSVTVFAQHYLNATTNSQTPEARRYAADGSVDLAFGGGDGVAPLTALASSNAPVRVLPAGGGRVLFAGDVANGAERDALVRLEPDGDPDPTFDGDGVVRGAQLGPDRDVGNFTDVRVDAAGRVVLTALTSSGSNVYPSRVIRLNADGSMDASFGSGGFVYRPLPAPWMPAYEATLAPLPDGSILVAHTGYPTATAPTDLGVVRLAAADGAIDPTFGAGGVARRAAEANRFATVTAAALGPDGRLVAAAFLSATGDGPGLLAGFTTDGAPDARVGPAGLRAIDPGAQDVYPGAVTVGPDGKTVVAGYTSRVQFNGGGSSYVASFLARLNADGTLDPTFGPDGTGFVSSAYGPTTDFHGDVVVRADGRIVTVTSGAPVSAGGRAVAVRGYLPDGRPDPSFAANGVFDVRSVTTRPIESPSLDLAADGTLLVTAKYATGGTQPQHGRVVLALAPAGQLVGSFGTGGVADVEYGWDASPRPSRDAAGNLYLFGTSGTWLRAVRLTPTGQVDAAYGNTARPGLFEAQVVAGGTSTFLTRFAPTADGKILGYGSRSRALPGGGTDNDYLAVRLLASGQPDLAFGPGGELLLDRGGASERFEWAGVRPDGRIVLAGRAGGPDGRYAIAAVQLQGDAPVAPPAVQSVAVNGGAAQRSTVTSLTVAFDRPVSADPGAFAVAGRNGAGVGATVAAANPSRDGRTWVLTFTGPGVVGGGLPDGVYDLTVIGSKVRGGSAAGPAMAADHTAKFHRLYSDADGDGDSDNADLFQFRAAYGKFAADPGSGYRPEFDHDADGDVDAADLFQVRSRRAIEYKGY